MDRNKISTYARNTCIGTVLGLCTALVCQPAFAQGTTYSVLYSFLGSPDGAGPNQPIMDKQGNIYGTTRGGGLATCGLGTCGTIFEIDNAGHESVLFSFFGNGTATNPFAPVVEDTEGNLWGTTQGEGFINGAAVVFKFNLASSLMTSFNPTPIGVGTMDSPVVLDPKGNVYVESPFGGTPNCGWNSFGNGCGLLFKVSPDGNFTILHTFDGTDGMQPEGGLVRDSQGNLYGVTYFGGKHSCFTPGLGYEEPGCGTVFKLDTAGNFSTLYTFTDTTDGGFPQGLIIDSNDNLYGIASFGGIITPGQGHYGRGTIFEIDASGNFSVLFAFTNQITKNETYVSHLLRDTQGNLYGEKENDCAHNAGCIFRVDTQGNYNEVYNFAGCGETTEGNFPSGMIFGPDHDIYGSMISGGIPLGACGSGNGTIFHVTF